MTDIRNFSGRGDIFPEHMRHIPEVLMIVLKYLMGQFLFLMASLRDFHTVARHERSGVKGLRLSGGGPIGGFVPLEKSA